MKEHLKLTRKTNTKAQKAQNEVDLLRELVIEEAFSMNI